MWGKWHRYRYKNLTYLFLSFGVAVILAFNKSFHDFLSTLGNYGYFGAFTAGLLFTSSFGVSISAVILLTLVEYLNPWELVLIAGIGAVIGDLFIFYFIRNKGLIKEITHFFEFFGTEKIHHLIHTKYFSWTLPVIGALIIASPLPDEIGIGLMGISKLKVPQFIVVSFVFNMLGILLVISGSILQNSDHILSSRSISGLLKPITT